MDEFLAGRGKSCGCVASVSETCRIAPSNEGRDRRELRSIEPRGSQGRLDVARSGGRDRDAEPFDEVGMKGVGHIVGFAGRVEPCGHVANRTGLADAGETMAFRILPTPPDHVQCREGKYAGGQCREPARSRREPRPSAGVPTFCLTVRTVADPGSLPRLIEVFAKRGLIPSKLFSVATGADELTVDLQVAGLEPELGSMIASQLRSQVGIETVLTSMKTEAD